MTGWRETPCVETTFGRDRKGYGHTTRNGRTTKAHRLAWEAVNGPIPAGMHVLHRCDNPPCVNPAHLFIGTNEENHRDKIAKGRQVRGEQVGGSRLVPSQVLEIRARLAAGESQRVVARAFGIDQSSVSHIVSGRSWSHVK